MTTLPSLVQLKPFLQPFPYGREGLNSWAAQFALATPSLRREIGREGGIKDEQPYGEIWLGSTHENGPSTVEGQERSLRMLIQQDPAFYLGEKLLKDGQMSKQYHENLPYLFKVLSFDKPLPLQCHPDKHLGEQLKNQEKKKLGQNQDFVDSNAKPEVGIALSPFTAFVGFRPLQSVATLVQGVEEFKEMFQPATLAKFLATTTSSPSEAQGKAALRSLFYEAINLPPSKVKDLTQRLSARLEKDGDVVFGVANLWQAEGAANGFNETEAAVLARTWRICVETYGTSDPGSLAASALMNLLRMKKGEGAWIQADDLHAYVDGDIIECMANSDSMVAHGLGTEAQGGVSTFVEMLTYRHTPAAELLLKYEDAWSKGRNGRTRFYDIPIPEFDLLSISLSPTSAAETLSPLDGPLTFVVTQGSVTLDVGTEQLNLSKGQVGFVRAGVEIAFTALGEGETEVWGAFYQ